MRLPKTSRKPYPNLREAVLGRGDYAAGGACSLPFLDLDGARRRRPLVFGEVTDDLDSYPALAAEMFSGRQTDPSEWAVMWREIGADGVYVDLRGDDADLVREISRRTRLPLAVRADDTVLEELSGIDDTVMILMGRGHDYRGPCGCHAVTVTGPTVDVLAGNSSETEGSVTGNIVLGLEASPVGEGLADSVAYAEEVRRRALAGEPALRHPAIADVTGSWSAGFPDARSASMWEAEAALAAMLAGADILIVKGPGAADMARVYGEELADL